MSGRPSLFRLRLAYGLCFVLIATSLAVIVWKLPRLRATPEPEDRRSMTPEVVGKLLSRSLPLDASRSLRLAASQADYLVLFLFTPADCAACLPELRDLSRFDQVRRDVDVVAIISFSNPDEARQTRENFHLEIPVVQDPYGEILESVDPPKTPWRVVVRRVDRQVLFEGPSSVSPGERAEFLSRLRQLGAQGSNGSTAG